MNPDLARYANPHVRQMAPYTPGRQMNDPDWIKLNTNELPYPPSPRVTAAIEAELCRLSKYPDPRSEKLREAIAGHHELAPEQVIAGNGSDDILNLLCRVFAGPGRTIGRVDPSYSLYPVVAAAQGAEIVEVPLDESFAIDPASIAASGANLFFLTSPNAPSGVGYSAESLRRVAEALDGILVVDEAYATFADETAVDWVGEVPNLVVTRTFSKAFGLAGLRVGYGLADASIIELLDRVRDAYNLDRFAQAGAAAALDDSEYFAALIDKVRKVRDFYAVEFLRMGWTIPRSQANFLFVRPARADGVYGEAVARSLMEWLESNQILVRYFGNHPLTKDFLRISVGDESQMARLMEVIEEWRQETN